jgi:hypothetical protein
MPHRPFSTIYYEAKAPQPNLLLKHPKYVQATTRLYTQKKRRRREGEREYTSKTKRLSII